MTLSPCYRASCDVPECSAAEVFAPGLSSLECRERLAELGWAIIPWRVRSDTCGAPRISYMCPTHHEARPPGWREARLAKIQIRTRRPRAINLDGVSAPTAHLDAAARSMIAWMLVEACGSIGTVAKAFGVSRQRVHQMITSYSAIVDRRRRSAEGWQEPWARRLREAGAIR